MNELKKIKLQFVINESDITKFLKYFDFAEEYNNKEYIAEEYEFDYGFGLKKYSNVIFIIDEEINNTNGENYILRNCEYVVAREIFNRNELVELEKFCPCSKCLSLNVDNLLPVYQDMFSKYCIGKYKTKLIAMPLVQEARKLKNNCINNNM